MLDPSGSIRIRQGQSGWLGPTGSVRVHQGLSGSAGAVRAGYCFSVAILRTNCNGLKSTVYCFRFKGGSPERDRGAGGGGAG